MNKLIFLCKILIDRLLRPYDRIVVRFNTKAPEESDLVWRIFVNDVESLASGIEIHGFVYDEITFENGVKKYNIGCMGRLRWEGSKAIIFAAKKPPELLA